MTSSRRAGAGHLALSAVAGIVTALVALAVAQIVAAVIASPLGAPVAAVGELSIDHAPAAVKDFAISAFGTSDKTALVWGIRVVLLLFAALIGVLGARRLWHGMIGLALFGVIGIYSALVQAHATGVDALPSLVGAGAGALALWYSAGRVRRLQRGPQPAVTADTPTSGPAGRAIPAGPGGDWRLTEPGAARPATPAAGPGATATAARERRTFLLGGAAVAGTSLLTYAVGSWLANSRNVGSVAQAERLPAPAQPAPPLPPGTDLKISGLSSFVTPNKNFYRVDTALILPEVLPSSWKLRIHGMVSREVVLTFDDLLRRPLMEDWITLCCVSNPVGGPYVGNARWLGASLRSLLQAAGIKAGASQLLCTSTDGFTSGTPVQTAMDGRDALLAVGMNGVPLPVEHGFPARLVIPGLYGYVSACKWITDIEVTTYADAHAYWVPRGWAPQAPIKTESRIDVPTGSQPVKAGQRVTIAGVAWAQHKGIEAVEVHVDNGPWQQARLAAVPGIDTWRQWVYEWTASVRPGSHLIEARATDKTGYTQTSLAVPEVPNGASGYPSVLINVVS